MLSSDLWISMVRPTAYGDVLVEESPCLHVRINRTLVATESSTPCGTWLQQFSKVRPCFSSKPEFFMLCTLKTEVFLAFLHPGTHMLKAFP